MSDDPIGGKVVEDQWHDGDAEMRLGLQQLVYAFNSQSSHSVMCSTHHHAAAAAAVDIAWHGHLLSTSVDVHHNSSASDWKSLTIQRINQLTRCHESMIVAVLSGDNKEMTMMKKTPTQKKKKKKKEERHWNEMVQQLFCLSPDCRLNEFMNGKSERIVVVHYVTMLVMAAEWDSSFIPMIAVIVGLLLIRIGGNNNNNNNKEWSNWIYACVTQLPHEFVSVVRYALTVAVYTTHEKEKEKEEEEDENPSLPAAAAEYGHRLVRDYVPTLFYLQHENIGDELLQRLCNIKRKKTDEKKDPLNKLIQFMTPYKQLINDTKTFHQLVFGQTASKRFLFFVRLLRFQYCVCALQQQSGFV